MPDTLDAGTARTDPSCGRFSREALFTRYAEVRGFSERLCRPLIAEDFVIQSMPEVSPTKWHLAHTTWFFETFLLKPALGGYRESVPEYAYLFNSYYNAAGAMHCRDKRGLVSRPGVEATFRYRREVDGAVRHWIESSSEEAWEQFARVLDLGLHHEQQHQELLLTDIKHVFAQNPLHPVYLAPDGSREAPASPPGTARWISYPEGICEIGHEGAGFCFDNERPRHRQFLEAYSLGSRLVTNGEFLEFLEDEGYRRSELWLALGWTTVREQDWQAPLYWVQRDGRWHEFTLRGLLPLDLSRPVCHVSYFEADAYARWAGARLPTEAEWESAAGPLPIEGSFADAGGVHPAPAPNDGLDRPVHMFGEVWQWTLSHYSPYPGYAAPPGALGEYNGKFMCSQMVLRGGSCATSKSHIRATYRNFFQPDKRWQFSGIRLARHEF